MLLDQIRGYHDGWQAAPIPAAWQEILINVLPDLGSVRNDVPEGGAVHPPLQADEEQPHIFRAFRNLHPEAVHTVVIGQDPYPEVQRATGRAFEDWGVPELDFSVSLKRLLQSALAYQKPDLNADQNDTGWQEIREEVTGQLANREAMTAYFDRLAAQGVLFLNAAWTCSAFQLNLSKQEKKRISNAHRVFWRPVMQKLIADLAAREQSIAFILLGKTAQNLLSGIEGVFRHSAVVPNNHPGRPAYFGNNPFRRLKTAQEQLAGAEIHWWPPQEQPPAGPNVGGDP